MGIPHLFFEQISLREKKRGDFTEDRQAELTDGKIRSECASIEKSNEEILSRYDADAMREAVMRKMSASKPNAGQNPNAGRAARTLAFRSFVAVGAAAACFAFAFFVASPRGDLLPRSGAQGIFSSGAKNGSGILASAERAKGDGAHLFVYLKDGNKAIRLDGGEKVKEGDVLQLSYISGGAQYGAILSIDGKGTVSFHYPESGGASAKLQDGGEIPLDFAYQLDNAPNFERFFFITGSKPFTTAAFVENIKIRSKIGDLQTADLSRIAPLGTKLVDLTVLK
jgi:hypothetical protein